MAHPDAEFTALLRRMARSHLGTASAAFDQAADRIDALAGQVKASEVALTEIAGLIYDCAARDGNDVRTAFQIARAALTKLN